ncbi:MAG: hypothetical protein R3D51_17955 [Hyphomicrobiaceae bacterium]
MTKEQKRLNREFRKPKKTVSERGVEKVDNSVSATLLKANKVFGKRKP